MNQLSREPVNQLPRKPVNELSRKPVAREDAKSLLESYHLLDDLIDDYLEPHHAVVKTSSTVEVVKQTQIAPTTLSHQKSFPVLVPSLAEPAIVSSYPEPGVAVSSKSRWKAVVDETVVSSSRGHAFLVFIMLNGERATPRPDL